ncbi:MAG: polysaccharide pyruvyl transferase family protein, partial [Lachnospiraceae bacterium]|nr:polysaccharide pyruvyl transferase family protein [Lachnospiraceae bacterium]
YTLQSLKNKGIEAEFSGCITLTLPKQKKVPREREYICLVDVSAKVEKYVRARLEGTDIDIKVITHDVDQKAYKSLQWSERSQIVEDTLTVYQNAKCVLTRRLHCALPCLAMGVPVLLVIHTLESIRFDPYYDWLRCCKPEQYISGEYDFDVLNPPDNKTNHLETRRSLTRKVEEFIADTMNRDHPVELLKFHVPEKKVEKWRYKKMLSAAKTWYHVNRADREEIRDLQKTEKGSGRNRKQLSLLTEQEYFEEWEKFRKSLFLRTIPEKNQMLEQRMLVELRYMRKNYDEMKRLKNKLKK